MSEKTALIFGVTGQDGALLAQLLVSKGYHVVGQSRLDSCQNLNNLVTLGVLDDVELRRCDTLNIEEIGTLLKNVNPHEVYNLSGQSSVGKSFDEPLLTYHSHATVVINVLDMLRKERLGARFFNAGSGEIFGETSFSGVDETGDFNPVNPYGMAKASAAISLANYRSVYGLFACTGYLFNHESPLRPQQFVTQKVVAGALRIANGSTERLRLGNLGVTRDWGSAKEYVDAMWRTLQQNEAQDYVISTGKSNSLEHFVSIVFKKFSLDWRDHVEIDPSLFRSSDITVNVGNPSKANEILQWEAKVGLDSIIEGLIEAAIQRDSNR